MSVSQVARFGIKALFFIVLPLTAGAFTFSQKDAGARAHPMVLERHGGALSNPALQQYVGQIADRLAVVTSQPNEDWSVTILDDPAIRAFAQPGGYIYVSRGLMAFATSEAELASAIAHQMAHQLRNHLGLGSRRPLGSELSDLPDRLEMISALPAGESPSSTATQEIGAAPFLTQKQESIAAQDGILILAKANYPTAAAADLAERLIALDGAWGEPGVLPVRMLGTLPEDRYEAALAIIDASASTTVFEADPRRAEYLRSLQGMVWGNSPSQGFVRGNQFLHPAMGFTFEAPLNFLISHTPAEVVAAGPNGARMLLDTAEVPGPRLESYIRDVWAPNLTRTVEAGYLYDLRSLTFHAVSCAGGRPLPQPERSQLARGSFGRLIGQAGGGIRSLPPAPAITTGISG